MENKKYYTPSIEEFHIGFEFEYLAVPRIKENNGYIKSIFDFSWSISDILHRIIDFNCLRIKYLDKVDIESLGFTYIKDVFSLNKLTVQSYKKDDIILYHTSELNKIMITYSNEDIIVSSISIKNKSKLIKLLKALNIN